MSRHVQKDKYYQFKQGLPSGHPLTSIINSIYNLAAVHCVFGMVFDDLGIDLCVSNHVRVQVYGDDNVIGVSDWVASQLNPAVLPEYFSRLGLKYGNAEKDGNLLRYIYFSDVMFLKRRFRDDEFGFCIAPLEFSSMLDSLNWTKKGELQDQIMIDKIDTFFLELSLHGEKVFNDFAPVIHLLSEKHYRHTSRYHDYQSASNKALMLEARW